MPLTLPEKGTPPTQSEPLDSPIDQMLSSVSGLAAATSTVLFDFLERHSKNSALKALINEAINFQKIGGDAFFLGQTKGYSDWERRAHALIESGRLTDQDKSMLQDYLSVLARYSEHCRLPLSQDLNRIR